MGSAGERKLLPSDELARHLHLPLDYSKVQRGEPYPYTELHDFLADRGLSLSRSRRSYMLRGEVWRVRERTCWTGSQSSSASLAHTSSAGHCQSASSPS